MRRSWRRWRPSAGGCWRSARTAPWKIKWGYCWAFFEIKPAYCQMQAMQEGPSNVQDELKFLELLLSLNLADLCKWFHPYVYSTHKLQKEHKDSNKQNTKFIFALWQSLGFILNKLSSPRVKFLTIKFHSLVKTLVTTIKIYSFFSHVLSGKTLNMIKHVF